MATLQTIRFHVDDDYAAGNPDFSDATKWKPLEEVDGDVYIWAYGVGGYTDLNEVKLWMVLLDANDDPIRIATVKLRHDFASPTPADVPELQIGAIFEQEHDDPDIIPPAGFDNSIRWGRRWININRYDDGERWVVGIHSQGTEAGNGKEFDFLVAPLTRSSTDKTQTKYTTNTLTFSLDPANDPENTARWTTIDASGLGRCHMIVDSKSPRSSFTFSIDLWLLLWDMVNDRIERWVYVSIEDHAWPGGPVAKADGRYSMKCEPEWRDHNNDGSVYRHRFSGDEIDLGVREAGFTWVLGMAGPGEYPVLPDNEIRVWFRPADTSTAPTTSTGVGLDMGALWEAIVRRIEADSGGGGLRNPGSAYYVPYPAFNVRASTSEPGTGAEIQYPYIQFDCFPVDEQESGPENKVRTVLLTFSVFIQEVHQLGLAISIQDRLRNLFDNWDPGLPTCKSAFIHQEDINNTATDADVWSVAVTFESRVSWETPGGLPVIGV